MIVSLWKRKHFDWSGVSGGSVIEFWSRKCDSDVTAEDSAEFDMRLLLPPVSMWISTALTVACWTVTDNGSCYIADSTRTFTDSLGFIVCMTPVRSPESNGMAGSFIKTLKRNYVYVIICRMPLP